MGSARGLRRVWARWAVIVLLGAGLWPLANHEATADQAPPVHTVIIQGVRFEPADLTVHRGDVIVWVNQDPFPHTVTAAGAFDSGSIAAGRHWRYVARQAGRFEYVCTLHPTMKATLRVE